MQKVLFISLLSVATTAVFAESDVLNEVIVTATRSEIDTAEAPASVTVISRKEIEQKGGENVLDLIRGTTGISLQGIGSGGRKTLSLRGLESKHTLILVDGKRIPGSNDTIGPNTDYQYDWVPTSQIERIEVVRGPMSVLYGADALGGVINIITREPSKKLAGSVKLTSRLANGDSNDDGDGHDAAFNISGGVTDNLQLSVGAKHTRRSSVEKIYLRQSAIEGREKKQLSLGLDWQPADGHNIDFEYSTAEEDRWFDTNTEPDDDTGTPYQSTYDINRQHLSLGWKGPLGDNITSELRAYQSKVDITNHATNGETPSVPQKLTDTILEGKISFPVGQKQFITAGLENRNEELVNPNLVTGKDDFTLNSLYVQDEIDITDNLLFTLGARLDDHEVFGSEMSPRASLVWNATDKLILKGSYGHGFKAPNIKQVSPGYVFNVPNSILTIASNPDLKPELNDALELGANYSTDKFNIDVALFDNKVKDLIDTVPTAFPRLSYININEARLKGAEISTKILLSKNLNFNASYQYLDAKNGTGERLDRRPRHTLSAGTTWKKNGWKLSLNAEYLADQLIEEQQGRTWVPTKVPNYTIWNAGARKSLNKNLELAIGIDNLTDVRLEDESTAFRHEEYPRTLRLELRGKF